MQSAAMAPVRSSRLPRRRRRVARVILFPVVLWVLLGATGRAQSGGSARGSAPPVPPPDGYPGVLLPGQTALVKSKYDDRVAEVAVELGRWVTKGQLLLRFVDDEYKVEVDRAAALLDRARADFARARELHEQRNLSDEQFEKAQTGLRLAEVDHELARIRLRERSIVAPFDGVLAERYVDPGASVQAGDPLLRVTALSPLRVEALLPEEMLPLLRATPRVRVTFTSPDTVLLLAVRRMPTLVDPASGLFPLQIEINNPRGRLIPGVSCRVHLGAAGR